MIKKINTTEENLIIDLTSQIVRYLFSQYLNPSDQPIGFKWNEFDNMMADFCQKYFIKSFDKKSHEEISQISLIIKKAAINESRKIMMNRNIAKLPVKEITDEIDLLNSIYFDITVSLLNSFYHKDYFSNFFKYNLKNETPSISTYLEDNRNKLKNMAMERLDFLCLNFNIEPVDKKLLFQKMNKYYSFNLH